MFRFINIYYGMSGTFKSTTIESEINKWRSECKQKNENTYSSDNIDVMRSSIKTWKYYEKILGQDQLDLNYANLHLCRLKDHIYDSSKNNIQYLLVERGITDMLYYYFKNNPLININESWINNVVNEENILCEQNHLYTPNKILLIQKDIDFIENVILKEPTRSKEFPGGVKDYLENQSNYIEFTKSYNNITKEIIIKDAEKYIVQDLGLKYNLNSK